VNRRAHRLKIKHADRIGQIVIRENLEKPAKRLGAVAWARLDVVGKNALCPQYRIYNALL
jgi:hypothetical protein